MIGVPGNALVRQGPKVQIYPTNFFLRASVAARHGAANPPTI